MKFENGVLNILAIKTQILMLGLAGPIILNLCLDFATSRIMCLLYYGGVPI